MKRNLLQERGTEKNRGRHKKRKNERNRVNKRGREMKSKWRRPVYISKERKIEEGIGREWKTKIKKG